MPEGGEIKRAVDEVRKAIGGKKTTKVFFAFGHLKKYEAVLKNSRVTSVESRGKAMLTRFGDLKLNLYSHNQLYGRWVTVKNDQDGDYTKVPFLGRNRQLRVGLYTKDRSALLYSASSIEVLEDDELEKHKFLSKLGVDVLGSDVTVGKVESQMREKKFSKRRLCNLFLSQEFVGGIGNYLRSEILFSAGLHPYLRMCDLEEDQIKLLAQKTFDVTWQSYHKAGVTLDLDIVKTIKEKNPKARKNSYRFWVFGRDGKKCRKCDTIIKREEMTGRRIYICEECQPEPDSYSTKVKSKKTSRKRKEKDLDDDDDETIKKRKKRKESSMSAMLEDENGEHTDNQEDDISAIQNTQNKKD